MKAVPTSLRAIKYQLLGIAPESRPAVALGLAAGAEWTETDTLQYLRQTKSLAQLTIEKLSFMSDLQQPPALLPSVRVSHRPTREISAVLAQLRPNKFVPHALAQLVRYDYGAAATERISLWLFSILNVDARRAALPALQLADFNKLVAFFLAIQDTHAALFVLNRMHSHHVAPNRATVHLFLRAHAARVRLNPYPLGQSGHPLFTTQKCLDLMDQFNLKADKDTWNLVLQTMPLGFGKSFLIEEMDRRAIELVPESKHAVLETIIEHRKTTASSNDTTQQLLDSLDSQDAGVVALLVNHLLTQKCRNNANVARALRFLDESPLSIAEKQSTAMLNTFLQRFAERRHLDWQFGVLAKFPLTTFDSKSWQYFLTAAVLARECASKYVVVGTVLKQMERENAAFTPRAKYLARRALAKATHPLRDLGDDGWQKLKRGLAWDAPFCPKDPGLLKSIGFGAADRTEGVAVDTRELHKQVEGMPRTDSPLRKRQVEEFIRS